MVFQGPWSRMLCMSTERIRPWQETRSTVLFGSEIVGSGSRGSVGLKTGTHLYGDGL